MLEQSGGAGASSGNGGPLRDLAVQQRPGGRVRAWALGSDGAVSALDEAPVSRGVRGACAQLLGDTERGLASVSDAELQLQVRVCTVLRAARDDCPHPAQVLSA